MFSYSKSPPPFVFCEIALFERFEFQNVNMFISFSISSLTLFLLRVSSPSLSAQCNDGPELAVNSSPTSLKSAAVVTGDVTAIGIGVAYLSTRMIFVIRDEDILGAKSGGPVIVPMKCKDARLTNILPVSLQFTIADPKNVLAKIVAPGGLTVEKLTSVSTGQKQGTLYTKDPDGYLIKLVPSAAEKGVRLSVVGYVSSNPGKSATFFSKFAGTDPKPSIKADAWDITVVQTKQSFDIQSLDFHDQRTTKSLPLKIVWVAPTIEGLKSMITSFGGGIINEIAARLDLLSGWEMTLLTRF
jgi:hypothetical protein